jgi:hypothetical protein
MQAESLTYFVSGFALGGALFHVLWARRYNAMLREGEAQIKAVMADWQRDSRTWEASLRELIKRAGMRRLFAVPEEPKR